MSVYDAMMARRSIRKFKQAPINKEDLVKLVDVARYAPTGTNRQPLKFAIISDPSLCGEVFPHTKWAASLKGAHSPSKEEAPTAYIAVLSEAEDTAWVELAAGAAIENMLILAQDLGIGSCWLGAIEREPILALLGLSGYKLLYLAALGYPAESPVAADFEGNVQYYLDENRVLHVPKKSFDQVVVFDQ